MDEVVKAVNSRPKEPSEKCQKEQISINDLLFWKGIKTFRKSESNELQSLGGDSPR